MSTEHLPTVVSSTIVAIVILVMLRWIVRSSTETNSDRASNYLVILLGIVVGWVLGALVAPFNTDEAMVFKGLGQAITLFFSGYVLSKLDRFTEEKLFGVNAKPDAWIKMGLFLVSMLLSAVYVYSIRYYLNV
ncbi:hypothetical protein F0M18_02635 [Pseudohalioglobus sediminis]|uniref:Uncharacterized protein n=1 Tax=Pseudohalioglobus sediminis TaxID=2606449 RepID=A0A5B0X6S5_9GAMM|nr:hypothetical protein [Pseudohalioglobus sediminis]KAA1194345.1 hypothetical protein F0M18_02635 [Pseudohalioglobus sediminis]